MSIELSALEKTVTVEYVIRAPTCYRDGLYSLAYPDQERGPFVAWATPQIHAPGQQLVASRKLPKEHLDLLQLGCHADRGPHTVVQWIQGPVQRELSKRSHHFDLGNGSHLDRALTLASEVVKDVQGPIRIVSFGDHRLRGALSPEVLSTRLGTLPGRASVHLARLRPGKEPLTEHSRHSRWRSIPEAYGGELFEIAGNTDDPRRNRDVMLHLVRPTRIDEFAIHAGTAIETPVGTLSEGAGYRQMALAASLPRRVRLGGRLWSKRWQQTLVAKPKRSQDVLSLAVADRVTDQMTDGDFKKLARAAKAVTSQTSYLARDKKRRELAIPSL